MDPAKSGVARPISGRPLTSGRAMTNTGLIAPKSSRGKTALRRQIQDKSYFIGLLRSKINEINSEKNVLLRECDIMSKEEARIGVYRQKAEILAKDLTDSTLELSTYNEFLERLRVGDDVQALRDDCSEIKHENEALIVNLENDYSRYKNYENTSKRNEDELQEMVKNFNSIKNEFTTEQRSKFNALQTMNDDLSKECLELENEIAHWRTKKNEIEDKTSKEGNLLKMEMLQAISKLRHLEKQKNELSNVHNSEENERANILAQVKRDNNYISSLENKKEQLSKTLEEIENEIEFYNDDEKLLEFSDFKEKEKSFDDFMAKFESDKKQLFLKMESVNNEINDISSRSSRCLKYLTKLKQISNKDKWSYDITSELIVKKRKLELDLNKIEQMSKKSENEKEIMNSKITKLQDGINSYSDIAKLKSQIQSNLENVKQNAGKVKDEIAQMKLQNEKIESETRKVKLQLENDQIFKEINRLEEKLRNILKVNEALKANDSSQMMNEIKSIVLENTKKYNQNLLGF